MVLILRRDIRTLRVMKTAFQMPRRVVGALTLASAAIIVFSMTDANTQTPAPPLEVPARTLPVPETVSPEMQRLVGAPLSGELEHLAEDHRGVEEAVGAVRRAGRRSRCATASRSNRSR